MVSKTEQDLTRLILNDFKNELSASIIKQLASLEKTLESIDTKLERIELGMKSLNRRVTELEKNVNLVIIELKRYNIVRNSWTPIPYNEQL